MTLFVCGICWADKQGLRVHANMDEGMLDIVRYAHEKESEFGDTTTVSLLIEAHLRKRVCLYGAYAVYVMSYLSESQHKYMDILFAECHHEKGIELHEYVNSSEDTFFVQLFVMHQPGNVECFYAELQDLAHAIACSLEDTGENSAWREWRHNVLNSKDVPEFVMDVIMQLDHDFIMRIFPALAHNFWKVGTSLADGVQPHESVLHAMKILARRVPVGEWYKCANVSRARKSPNVSPVGVPASSPLSPLSPSSRTDPPGNALVSLTVHILAYDAVQKTSRLHRNCPEMFALAPHAFSAACTEIRETGGIDALPQDMVEAAKGVVSDYKFLGRAVAHVDRAQKLYSVVLPYALLSRDEAMTVIADIDPTEAAAQSPIPGDTTFVVVSGRVLRNEFNMTYLNANENGFGGLVAFLRYVGVNARVQSNGFRFRCHQLENGLLLQMPQATVRALDDGASLFATYLFPSPPHVGHPLYRYGALVRMLVYGCGAEVTWAVRILHYMASHNAMTTMADVTTFDNDDELHYIRRDVPRLLQAIITGISGKANVLHGLSTMGQTTLNTIFGVFLSLILCNKFGKVLSQEKMDGFLMSVVEAEVSHARSKGMEPDDSVNARVKTFRAELMSKQRLGGGYGRAIEEWYILPVMFVIQEATEGYIPWSKVAELLRGLDLVISVSGDCNVFVKAYSNVHSSVEYHSASEFWRCDDNDKFIEDTEFLDVFYGLCMAMEAMHMEIPLPSMFAFHERNLGAERDFSLACIKFPIFRTYNSLEGRVYEKEAVIMGRVGDIMDPITRKRDVLDYYNKVDGGRDRVRLHPSVFYGCTPWIVSDLIYNRDKRIPHGSPLTSPARHLSPFDREINSLAATASPRAQNTKRKHREE